MPPIPPITQFLMLACTAMFCLQLFTPIENWLALFPVASSYFLPWQLLTYAFLHGDMLHLFFNMLGLWMFGAELEMLWGRKRYLSFLAVGAVFGGLTFVVATALPGMGANSLVGASGSIYALLMAAAMYFPNRTIMPLFPPIPMKMKVFVAVFGAISLVLGLAGGLGSLAHLGGMIGGFLTIRYWRGQPPFGQRRR
jgi:membrane associated rhomboid family serine protease